MSRYKATSSLLPSPSSKDAWGNPYTDNMQGDTPAWTFSGGFTGGSWTGKTWSGGSETSAGGYSMSLTRASSIPVSFTAGGTFTLNPFTVTVVPGLPKRLCVISLAQSFACPFV